MAVRFVILWWAFVLPFAIQAQSFYIKGEVRDNKTHQPIENVIISVEDSQAATYSDQEGNFKIKISGFPVKLTFSHLAYFTKQILVNSQKATITVYLTRQPVTLQETEITAEKYKVFKNKKDAVLDFDFIGSNILVLVRKATGKKYQLALLNENLQIITRTNLENLNPPFSLFKDCFGNCHVVTSKAVYQVYFSGQKLYLIYPTPKDNFDKMLKNCLFETNKYLAFRNDHIPTKPDVKYASWDIADYHSNQTVNPWVQFFYLIDKKNHTVKRIAYLNEMKKKMDSYNYAVWLYSLPENCRPVVKFGDILRLNEMTWAKPSFQALKLLNDTIYYFNHLKSRIDVYSDKLKPLDTIPINYHKNKNWKESIITDPLRHKAYTLFTAGTDIFVKEINLKTGAIRPVFLIDKPFPEKIKINNGFIYFIYNDVSNIYHSRRLFQGILP